MLVQTSVSGEQVKHTGILWRDALRSPSQRKDRRRWRREREDGSKGGEIEGSIQLWGYGARSWRRREWQTAKTMSCGCPCKWAIGGVLRAIQRRSPARSPWRKAFHWSPPCLSVLSPAYHRSSFDCEGFPGQKKVSVHQQLGLCGTAKKALHSSLLFCPWLKGEVVLLLMSLRAWRRVGERGSRKGEEHPPREMMTYDLCVIAHRPRGVGGWIEGCALCCALCCADEQLDWLGLCMCPHVRLTLLSWEHRKWKLN